METTITCTCKTCTTNGKGRVLGAVVPTALYGKMLGNAKSARALNHSLVYDANNPGMMGQLVRERLGTKAL